MNSATLERLAREAEAPEGIAVRVSGPEMKRLLEERADLLGACWRLIRSATPSRMEHPTMFAAWRVGEAAVVKAEAP